MSYSVEQTVWLNMIEENLYDEAWQKLTPALRDDSAFNNSATIVIPQAGTASPVTVGNDTYPVQIRKRQDDVHTYNLTNLEIGPEVIQSKDGQTITYSKVESILRDLTRNLGLRAAREIMKGIYHSTANQRVETSGGSAGATHAPNSTQDVKAITIDDIFKAKKMLSNQDYPTDNLFLAIDYTMWHQLMEQVRFATNRDNVTGGSGLNDAIFPIAGVQPIVFSNVLFTQSNYTVRPVDHAGAAGDRAAAILFAREATSYAATPIQSFAEPGRSEYFGGTYSATIWLGGSYRRKDKKGVVPIVQANA